MPYVFVTFPLKLPVTVKFELLKILEEANDVVLIRPYVMPELFVAVELKKVTDALVALNPATND